MNQPKVRLRANWILPVSGPPIENGEVVVEADRIIEVCSVTNGNGGTMGDNVTDFGDAVLLPGLVNVHTHLDYTVMRGLFEDIAFFPWIRELTARKAAFTPEDWQASAAWGALEAVAGGVTTIGDCTDSGAAAHGARVAGLSGIIYQEVFGIDESQTVDQIMAELASKVERHKIECEGSRLIVGISPHAPYTVRPALFQALAEYADRDNLPVCIHAAESQAEAQLLRDGTGTIAAMYARRGIDWTPPRTSTVAYLDSLKMLTPLTLLVHGVQIAAQDRRIVQERGAAWAHCPKSNAKLGVGVAPLGLLRSVEKPISRFSPPTQENTHEGQESDINTQCATLNARIGLGSDSVASNNTMDLFEEMRFAVLMHRAARRKIEILSAQEAMEMATVGGATSLGMQAEIGTLEPGKRADLCVVRLNELHSSPAYNPYNALVYAAHASDVIFTMIGGQAVYDARNEKPLLERFPGVNAALIRKAFLAAAQKMRDWTPPA